MYLTESITNRAGQDYEMLGVIQGHIDARQVSCTWLP